MGAINRRIAEDIVKGKYDDDQPTKIVTYRNMFDGGTSYARVCVGENQMRYERSPACSDVRVWWTKEHGLLGD